ncbi:Tim10/DDP family zinc finger-domain-containing protein [Protomyces lactucae-debilis]|uniref:Mitochondrial import inner membrane translocase subunit n=1 Tax=Protomyces lactucae-debilis TaxID=2754530 RepID=A0A1Y2FMA5_PROLT|nr:Tim10/DDP family zinc finger-domain-containing protein [Protomyces lactucae-debilis]ORY85111.1 Tim10/DDP family zinc finger-domain-containing protein [Protomyces lactucae-debilis]
MVFGFGGNKTHKAADGAESPQSGMTPLSELGGSNKVQQLKAQVRQEMSVAHAQDLVSKMTSACFDKCVPNPESSLTGGQIKCISQCNNLYTQAWGVIQRSYIERVQQEQSAGNL